MKIHCTRAQCPKPENDVPNFQYNKDSSPPMQRFCVACGMPLILTGAKGRYQPLERLGGGGFGETFLAVDLHHINQRHCVVKRLNINSGHNPLVVGVIKRAFEREAKSLADLEGTHLHIPALYDYFTLTPPAFNSNLPQEFSYLVQQYIEGQDLITELQGGRSSESKIIEVWDQLLPLLEGIHNKNLIHRDIKPSNIIRRRENQKLYLIDFGAVKQVTQGVTSPHKSMVFATPGFAPPEQVLGGQVYPSSDLYTLAVSCVQLLTQNGAQNLRLPDNTWRWRDKSSPVSDGLAQILDKMLAANPDDRFQSARDVITAIAELKSPPPAAAAAPPAPPAAAAAPPAAPVPLKLIAGAGIILTSFGLLIAIWPSIPGVKKPDSDKSTSKSLTLSFEDAASGVKINYPDSWQLEKQSGSVLTGGIVARIAPKSVAPSPWGPEFLVSVERFNEPQTLAVYTQVAIEEIKNSKQDIKILNSQPRQLANRNGYQIVYAGRDNLYNFQFKAVQIWLVENKTTYVLTYRSEVTMYDKFLQPVERTMIGSFAIGPGKTGG